jgi:biopolymer transport protein ExbB
MLVSIELLNEYYQMGGFVMPPLVAITFLLWYALAIRYINLMASKRDPRDIIRRAKKKEKYSHGIIGEAVKIGLEKFETTKNRKELRAHLDVEYASMKKSLNQYKTLIKSIVIVAPLLGLLGTVDGMIETFNSLGDMALFSSTGGIAGGISKALFTTQMGLVISIPGLIVGRILDRKALNIERELDQVKDLICVDKEK